LTKIASIDLSFPGGKPLEPFLSLFACLTDLGFGRCVIKQQQVSVGPKSTATERSMRILAVALEVFSEYSFEDAATDEIARRARISKRDIYATFSDKHELLSGVVRMVLQADDEQLSTVMSQCEEFSSLQEKLDLIGLALMSQVLSPATGFVARLISSESIKRPEIGAIYFDAWYARRCDTISHFLSQHITKPKRRKADPLDTIEAARHYTALIAYLPYIAMMTGSTKLWNSTTVQKHVDSAVTCFLNAYPELP
jgi:AcrR family transcriptional regulator